MRAGLAVPPAFVIGIADAPRVAAGEYPSDLADAVERLVEGKREPRVAVRSGAEISIPGALDTLLEVYCQEVGAAVATVVTSTMSRRAKAIAEVLGHGSVPPTAVIVQCQVNAMADSNSGAGAATSRDPISGSGAPAGSFASFTRGDAVMAGTVPVESLAGLERCCPEVMGRLISDLRHLESEMSGPVEVEFVVESGRLWYLQVRRTRPSESVKPGSLPEDAKVLSVGRAASPGTASGELATDIDEALDAMDEGRRVVLALETTSPSDVEAMVRAAGVITVVGNPECHAAVVARAAGVPAVVSVRGLVIGDDHVMIGDVRVENGDEVLVDGTNGVVASATVTP